MSSERPRFEVADILRRFGDDYRRSHALSPTQAKATRAIVDCRTEALGGHVDACDACGHLQVSYNSCRNRHCPKCQGTAREKWLKARLDRLLPIPYFHVVFTIPHLLNPLMLRNRERLFDILFEAASSTLLTIAQDERHLGAHVGFTAVLHTWAQNLLFHPHLHCVVSAGGPNRDWTTFVHARRDYFLPVKVLAKLFRGRFLAALEGARESGDLSFHGSTTDLHDPAAWEILIDRLRAVDWVVYAKRPFAGKEHVFRYLGGYSHRIAIANHRILNVTDSAVTFRVRDRRNPSKNRPLTLAADEFLRRFLLHVLPDRFVRIRHFGIHAGGNALAKLEQARQLLADEDAHASAAISMKQPVDAPDDASVDVQSSVADRSRCPICETGHLVLVGLVSAMPRSTPTIVALLARPP